MKRYCAEKFLEIPRKVVFPNYLTYNCVNYAYSDFILWICRNNKFHSPSKKVRVKANSKAWFDNQIVSAIQRRNKLYKKVKHSGLETDMDNLKSLKCTRRK